MSTNSFTPAVPSKAKDILLSEGVVYKDYGEVGEALIGATRNGSKLDIEKVIKEVAYDGAMGYTKGMRRVETYKVKLTINFLKLTYTNMAYGLNVTVSDGSDSDGTYKKMTFDTNWADTDVLTNVTFKGYKLDGTYCIIKVENALNIDNLKIELKEKDELTMEMVYTGFYTFANPDVPPIKIQEEVA